MPWTGRPYEARIPATAGVTARYDPQQHRPGCVSQRALPASSHVHRPYIGTPHATPLRVHWVFQEIKTALPPGDRYTTRAPEKYGEKRLKISPRARKKNRRFLRIGGGRGRGGERRGGEGQKRAIMVHKRNNSRHIYQPTSLPSRMHPHT